MRNLSVEFNFKVNLFTISVNGHLTREVFRGLKFEPDAVIGQKGVLCKGLQMPSLSLSLVPSASGPWCTASSTDATEYPADLPGYCAHTFTSYTCCIYSHAFRMTIGLCESYCFLAQAWLPPMRFVSLRPGLCLPLPSDPASKRQPFQFS